jgi:hypothetical protein
VYAKRDPLNSEGVFMSGKPNSLLRYRFIEKQETRVHYVKSSVAVAEEIYLVSRIIS